MKTINFIFFILLIVTLNAQAEDMVIVDTRSNIPLSDEEPMYTDYVISSKDVGSLKKNLVVLVKRNLKMKNADAKDIGPLETARRSLLKSRATRKFMLTINPKKNQFLF